MCDRKFYKRKPQKVIVPQGLVREGETTVIEIPEEYKDEPVVVVTAKPCIATCSYSSSQNTTNIKPDKLQSNTNESFGHLNESLLQNTRFSAQVPLDSSYSKTVACNTSCPNVSKNRSRNTENLGLFDESILNKTEQSYTHQQANIPNQSAVNQNNNVLNSTPQPFSPPIMETTNVQVTVTKSGDESLDLLGDTILNSTQPFAPQENTSSRNYQSIINESLGLVNASNVSDARNRSTAPIPNWQTINNENLGIVEPHQMSTSFGQPKTVKTIKQVIITTTTSTTDQLNTTNALSQGPLGIEHFQQPAGSSPVVGTSSTFPNNTYPNVYESAHHTPKRKLDFSSSTSTNNSSVAMSLPNFATSTPSKSGSPIIEGGPSKSVALEQSFARDCGALDIGSVQNTSGNITKALDEYLRATEEREQDTLESDLKNYQEARRRLVADTTQLSSYNKTL